MKEKSEVKNALKNVLQYLKTLEHTVKELLSDNSGKFDNKEVQEILCE